MENIDRTKITSPSGRAAYSGRSYGFTLMMVDKINEMIDSMSSIAAQSTLDVINVQMDLFKMSLNAYNSSLASLATRVSALEYAPAQAIADLSSDGVNVSILNLAALQALGTQSANQAQTINKILAVMRTRKEINT